MRKQIFTLILLLCTAFNGRAAILRIGYPGTAVAGVDYTSSNISAAITAAAAGDTLQLYQQYWPGGIGSVSVNKPLNFIGFGYLLNLNPNLQAVTGSDINSLSFSFVAGSAGSKVTGVYCNSINISANNISISRCKIVNNLNFNTNTAANSNSVVTQCFFVGGYISSSSTFPVNNVYITNNIFASFASVSLTNGTGVFTNNIVAQSSLTLQSFIVRNNIFGSGCPSSQTNVFHNNIFGGAGCSNITGTGNQFNVNMSDVFVNWNNGNIAADSQLVLKAGSPAVGAGLRNDNSPTDMGVFGGEPGEQYRLSGIPPVPSIYQLSAPSQIANTSSYTITISVRSNN